MVKCGSACDSSFGISGVGVTDLELEGRGSLGLC